MSEPVLNCFHGYSIGKQKTCTAILIILGENEEHNKEISRIVAELGMEVYYTHDILNCGSNFYHTLYRLTDHFEPEYYCFEVKVAVA